MKIWELKLIEMKIRMYLDAFKGKKKTLDIQKLSLIN
jgi:hypothetical protein